MKTSARSTADHPGGDGIRVRLLREGGRQTVVFSREAGGQLELPGLDGEASVALPADAAEDVGDAIQALVGRR